ncbi:MAG: SsrA-binding protein SmpB [Sphingomonadales bacterium]|nr:SsrA-binding protein SmpB [Sphingomonadales bacterium]
MQALQNRQAVYDYFIDTRYQAGMVLLGTEVKSLREGKASFNDSFCVAQEGEVWIKSLHIAPYSHGTHSNHEPLRDRKLLLTKKEISRIASALKEKGYTLVPLRIFFTDKGIVKIEIGLGRGKKQYDKRDSIKKREAEREIKRKGV